MRTSCSQVIPAFEEAVASMKVVKLQRGIKPLQWSHTSGLQLLNLLTHTQVGGVRRIIVPVEISYPDGDWRKLGPRPSTFAVSLCLQLLC